ncbi:insoluble matrix shell protein 2-like [Mercenaria mercenaria]|uniref:insoluble matrix shell protein 2-like n=1 Tax=Mercenaria mercenaria TaxID=6596 RepID=UPI00234F5357|nr:insoluble matrix shell protein 2-like [Mercenaria mercenaria]
MLQSAALRVLILFGLVWFCACVHVAVDLNGWKALPLDNKRAVDSMDLAAKHLAGTLKEPVTAFQWIEENVPALDLYRVSFIGIFQQGNAFECHADAVWLTNPSNITVFNTGCMAITLNKNLYGGVR